MNKKAALLFTLTLSFPGWESSAYAQGSTVSDSVRAMIERSQAATQFEQTARMQMSVQFGEFLDTLASEPQRKGLIEAALVAVLSERAELSSRVTAGQASATELSAVSDYAYLRARVAPLLSATELSVLDNRRSGPSDAQLKQDYAAELARTAGGLTEANRELVLDTLIRHNRIAAGDAADAGQLSVDELVIRQSQSLMNVREELQSHFSGEQLQQVTTFLNQLQANLYMNRSMTDVEQ